MLSKVSIRAGLTAMSAVFCLLLLIGAAAGLLALRASNLSLQEMYEIDTPAVADLEESATQMLRVRLALSTYSARLELGDHEGADAVFKLTGQYRQRSNDRLDQFLARVRNEGGQPELIDQMRSARAYYLT